MGEAAGRLVLGELNRLRATSITLVVTQGGGDQGAKDLQRVYNVIIPYLTLGPFFLSAQAHRLDISRKVFRSW